MDRKVCRVGEVLAQQSVGVFVPARCRGLAAPQKKIFVPITVMISRCRAITVLWSQVRLWRSPTGGVRGHEKVPAGGHAGSPVVAM